MFCQHCGNSLAAEMVACSSCGNAIPVAAANPAANVAAQIKSVSSDALKALRIFAVNPVGELANAYQTLGPQRAMFAGIVFGIVYDLAVMIGVYVMAKRSFGPFSGAVDEMSFKTVLKLALLGGVPLFAFALASLLTRKVFRGQGALQSDVFIAGAALLPAAALSLIAAIVGAGNIEVVIVLTVFTLCYTILLLFTGATKLSGISEGAAVSAVALMIIATAWIAKVVFIAVMS